MIMSKNQRNSRPLTRCFPVIILSAFMFLATSLLPSSGWCQKQIRLEIYPSTDSRIPIGVDPFISGIAESGLSREVSGLVESVLQRDLEFSLYFRLLAGRELGFGRGAQGKSTGDEELKAWKESGARFVVRGEIEKKGDLFKLDMKLVSLWTLKEIAHREYDSTLDALRWSVHQMSDDIIEIVTGEKGVSRSMVAYVVEKGKIKELYVMDYDGYDVRQLTRSESIVLSPAWSPDGKNIVFTSYKDDNPNLYMRNLENGTDIPLLSFPGINSAPSWSPDGRYLAVTLSKDGASEVYRFDNRTSVLRRLTYNVSIDTSPSWSPNGKQIIFTSDRAGNPHVYIMDADGSNLRRLTKSHPYNDTPIWSPIGDKIAFVSRERGEAFDVYTLDMLSGKVQQLTAVGSNTHPSWSPDGLHIVFSSSRDGQNEIYVMNWDGTGLKRLTYNGGNTSPAWSPRLKVSKGGDGK